MTDQERIRMINATASVFAVDHDEAVRMVEEWEPLVDAIARAKQISPEDAIAQIHGYHDGSFYVESEPDRLRRELRESMEKVEDAFRESWFFRGAEAVVNWLATALRTW